MPAPYSFSTSTGMGDPTGADYWDIILGAFRVHNRASGETVYSL